MQICSHHSTALGITSIYLYATLTMVQTFESTSMKISFDHRSYERLAMLNA